MGRKIRVGLVYGGKSGEHEVSLQTALAVMKAFDYDKYEIQPFYITKQGQWRTGNTRASAPAGVEELQLASAEDGQGISALAPIFRGLSGGDGAREEGGPAIDVMFPLLHGTNGEDGTVQGLFEIANIPYVGAGVLASAVGMDKVFMKKVFAQEGLPQCVFRSVSRSQWNQNAEDFLLECETALGYPSFVKPANLGSSVGVSKAKSREELAAAIEYAFRFDRKVIVEEFVEGREIEVSVLGNDEPIASLPGEIISSNDFYDYKAKYIDGKSVMQIPAALPEEAVAAIRGMAVRAFRSIDGSGLSRVDFFYRKTDGALLINEVNTLPGFTPFSMYPRMWQESGIPYRELLDRLIELALARHAEKQTIRFGDTD
ncbi:D-alanine--D-alanine ligase [Paenibacillus protaetiae]|uniref:D-alanine--D-alanine ligase n=1 Tax=Paenibacillus protaetiae TaxID=2509456 RepID=A0A4P6F1Y5_9BACL|nr:D-alanine--D-alanine ligase [Paenibacillus protaetiae]QAY67077.1 D-alanine--D-alanine ligase [Paenibacillus protaetiae]